MTDKTKITLTAAQIAVLATPAPVQVAQRAFQAPNAIFVGGTYADPDPDPNIRVALTREFSRPN